MAKIEAQSLAPKKRPKWSKLRPRAFASQKMPKMAKIEAQSLAQKKAQNCQNRGPEPCPQKRPKIAKIEAKSNFGKFCKFWPFLAIGGKLRKFGREGRFEAKINQIGFEIKHPQQVEQLALQRRFCRKRFGKNAFWEGFGRDDK